MASALVVGAGIAGLSVASALIDNGFDVTIIETESEIAAQASGNATAIISPYIASPAQIATNVDATAVFLAHAFSFTLDWLAELNRAGFETSFSQTGIVQLPSTRRLKRMLAEAESGLLNDADFCLLSSAEASRISGLDLFSQAFFYPRGGWLVPRILCGALRKKAGEKLTIIAESSVIKLTKVNLGWQASVTAHQYVNAEIAIVCNAYEYQALLSQELAETAPSAHIKNLIIEQVRGTIASAERSETTKHLKTVVYHNGYLVPVAENELVIGTTYRHGVFHRDRCAQEEEEMIANLLKWIPAPAPTITSARVCFRASTPDRLPYVGEIEPGLFVSIGHGSRGFITAPYSAKLLVDQILRSKKHSSKEAQDERQVAPNRTRNLG